MKALLLIATTVALVGCANHPVDCALGFVHDDCLPGTAGYDKIVNLQQQKAAAIAARQEADRNRCINYGFQEGTESFAQCRMTIDQQRQAAAVAMMQSSQANSAAIAGAILSRPAPQPYMMPTNPSITCNTFGNTTTCR
jgi:hypothetical protein